MQTDLELEHSLQTEQHRPQEVWRLRFVIGALVLLSVIYFAGLAHYAQERPVDGDEGYYATAARLVWEGKTPYRDFFYQQAPLLPYLYSWVYAIRPHSLFAMRELSAILGALTVCIWGLFLAGKSQLPKRVALVAFAFVALNPYWISWSVVVKTYAAANLLISAALICFYFALNSERVRWYFLAGCALGLCASVRSLYGPLIPFVLIWSLCRIRQGPRPDYGKVLTLFAGTVIGLLPMLISAFRSPGAFLFNNARYHSLDAGYMWLDGKLMEGYQSLGHVLILFVAHVVVGLFVFHPFFALEVALAVVGLRSWLKRRRGQKSLLPRKDDLYFQLVCVLFTVYTATALVPFPPYEQYFDSPLVPFLIPFLAEGVHVTLVRGRKLGWLIPVTAVLLSWAEVPRESAWNSNAPEWQVSSYRWIARQIEMNTSPNETVLSIWPGYVFESGRAYWPGLEDNFSLRITNKISAQERMQYHVPSTEEILRTVADRAVPLIIIGPENIQKEFDQDLSLSQLQEIRVALQENYVLLDRADGVTVYRRIEPGQPRNQTALPMPEIHDN
jgi:4-amino-4-deoxy-L-arabinose transferase-like glycosyltransferase